MATPLACWRKAALFSCRCERSAAQRATNWNGAVTRAVHYRCLLAEGRALGRRPLCKAATCTFALAGCRHLSLAVLRESSAYTLYLCAVSAESGQGARGRLIRWGARVAAHVKVIVLAWTWSLARPPETRQALSGGGATVAGYMDMRDSCCGFLRGTRGAGARCGHGAVLWAEKQGRMGDGVPTWGGGGHWQGCCSIVAPH